jgi:hypothetical protein
MSTQIIDNFKLNTNLPIDSRIVASGLVARDAIAWKYDGLRVYDISDHIPYVWIGSTSSGTWSSENILGISGTGTASYFAVFDSSNVIRSSNIYQKDSFVGINKSNPNCALDVNGVISGNGSLITSINPANISGNLSLSQMPVGNSGYILTGGGGITGIYRDPSSFTVGTSNVSLTSNVSSDASSTLCNIYFGTQSTSYYSALKYSSNIKFKPSTGQLMLSDGSATNPVLSFTSDDTSGIYKTSNGIGFSIVETNVVIIDDIGITVSGNISSTRSYIGDGILSTPSLSFISDTGTGIYRPSSNIIGFTTNGVERIRLSNSGLSIGDGSVFSQMFIGKLRVGHVTGSNADAVIVNATGFSIYGSPTWSASTEEVRFYIMTSVTFKSSTFSVICSIDDAVQNKHYQISCLGNYAGPFRFWFSVQRDSWTIDEYVTFSFIAFCN